MITDFKDFSRIYDEFRLSSQFYIEFEVPLLESLFKELFRNSDFGDQCQLLDLGCGTGIWTELASEVGRREGTCVRAIGIDVCEGMIDVARAKRRACGIDFQTLDCARFSSAYPRPSPFQVIISA